MPFLRRVLFRQPIGISLLLKLGLFGPGLIGCSTSPLETPPVSIEEQVKRRSVLNFELAQAFQSQIRLKQDTPVTQYLVEVANDRLLPHLPHLKAQAVRVELIARQPKSESLWKSYGLIGNRLYLPVALLSQLSYENQLAALIAVELVHLEQEDLIHRLEEIRGERKELQVTSQQFLGPHELGLILRDLDYSSATGIFAYPEPALLKAAEAATQVLYQSGYDPRGLIALLELYRQNLERSPYSAGCLDQLMAVVRRALVQQSPLRNPIVRTHAFLELQKRIQAL
jgi:hypothetical protein